MTIRPRSQTVVRILCLGLAWGLMPASAYAVNVSPGSGSGTPRGKVQNLSGHRWCARSMRELVKPGLGQNAEHLGPGRR